MGPRDDGRLLRTDQRRTPIASGRQAADLQYISQAYHTERACDGSHSPSLSPSRRLCSRRSNRPPLEIGAVAPDFSLPGATRYGVLAKPVRLSDFKGKTVVLAFFYKARTSG